MNTFKHILKFFLFWVITSFILLIILVSVKPQSDNLTAILFLASIVAPPFLFWYVKKAQKIEEKENIQRMEIEEAKLNRIPETEFDEAMVKIENSTTPLILGDSFAIGCQERNIELTPVQKLKLQTAIVSSMCKNKSVGKKWSELTLKNVAFVTQSNELAIVKTDFSKLWTSKTERRYQAGNRGVSVRVMKGLSVRVGNTAGRSISEEVTVEHSGGSMLVTTKHIYYEVDGSPQRLPLSKIIGVELFDEGETIKIVPDGTRIKPLIFFFKNIYTPYQIQTIINTRW